jgi:hypothetical protein
MTNPADARMTRLQWAVQALARPAKDQLTLFPDFVCKADELALEFDEHARPILDGEYQDLSTEQAATLLALDQYLESMSGGGANAENWTEDALQASPAWEVIRDLARAALAAFGWNDECPPADRGYVYVEGRPSSEPSP